MRVLINAFYCSQNASRLGHAEKGKSKLSLGERYGRDVISFSADRKEVNHWVFERHYFCFIEFFFCCPTVAWDKFPLDDLALCFFLCSADSELNIHRHMPGIYKLSLLWWCHGNRERKQRRQVAFADDFSTLTRFLLFSEIPLLLFQTSMTLHCVFGPIFSHKIAVFSLIYISLNGLFLLLLPSPNRKLKIFFHMKRQ